MIRWYKGNTFSQHNAQIAEKIDPFVSVSPKTLLIFIAAANLTCRHIHIDVVVLTADEADVALLESVVLCFALEGYGGGDIDVLSAE